jgi:hypothetical protein
MSRKKPSGLYNFVIKSAQGVFLGNEQISVVPAKGCRKNLKRHPDSYIRYEERNGESDAPHGYRGFTSTRLNGKGQPTMADVLASISERQGKKGTR